MKQNDIGRLQAIVFAFCKGVDTPRSLKLWLLVKNNEWSQVARFKVHPTEYRHHDDFAVDYAITNFLRKTEGLPSVVNTRNEAIRVFTDMEHQCARTNERLAGYLSCKVSPLNKNVNEVIHLAQRKIGNLLKSFSIGSALDACSWGNGATSDLSKSKAYLDDKMTVLPFSCTPAAWQHVARELRHDLHWRDAIIARNQSYSGPIIDGRDYDVYDTVPKTVLTDRSITKGPRMNGFLQRGAGKFIGKALRNVGIDLTDQSRNQWLAEHAQTLELATLDLESASDSVSVLAVKLLLPEPVYTYLDDIRCKRTDVDGSIVTLEKFSAMGNGFTFELESLIFWALASAASDISYRSIVGIFGDDIIVHRDVAPLLIDTLTFMGFSLNKEKSFIDGVFFESCGAHFFNGHNVTPIYQKCVPKTDLESVRLCNRLLRFAYRLSGYSTLDKRIEAAWRCAVREYSVTRFAGPIALEGDDYLSTPRQFFNDRAYRTNAGYRVLGIGEDPKWIPAYDDALYAYWLRESASREEHGECSRLYRLRRYDILCKLRTRVDEDLLVHELLDSALRIIEAKTPHGMIQSRVNVKLVARHRWVMPTRTSALDW